MDLFEKYFNRFSDSRTDVAVVNATNVRVMSSTDGPITYDINPILQTTLSPLTTAGNFFSAYSQRTTCKEQDLYKHSYLLISEILSTSIVFNQFIVIMSTGRILLPTEGATGGETATATCYCGAVQISFVSRNLTRCACINRINNEIGCKGCSGYVHLQLCRLSQGLSVAPRSCSPR